MIGVILYHIKRSQFSKGRRQGFSLIELSIVILIISILIVGSMSASVTAINNAKYKSTKDRIDEIYKAMGNYLLTNKSLPCPASITDLKTSTSTYGLAGTTAGSCNSGSGVYVGSSGNAASLVYGAVPVQSLGLSSDFAEDGFGSKFTYIVSKGFTNPSLTSTSSGFGSIYPAFGFSSPTSGFITLKENLGNGSFHTNTNDAIFVIISHGLNKYGSFFNNSATQGAASSDADEQNNYATGFSGSSGGTANFYTNDYFTYSSSGSDIFDDIVFYKTRNSMLIDFNALSLIVCGSSATNNANDNHGDVTLGALSPPFTWPQAYYNQVVSANEACQSPYTTTVTNPTKRCGAFGVWQAGAINQCTN